MSKERADDEPQKPEGIEVGATVITDGVIPIIVPHDQLLSTEEKEAAAAAIRQGIATHRKEIFG